MAVQETFYFYNLIIFPFFEAFYFKVSLTNEKSYCMAMK